MGGYAEVLGGPVRRVVGLLDVALLLEDGRQIRLLGHLNHYAATGDPVHASDAIRSLIGMLLCLRHRHRHKHRLRERERERERESERERDR